MANVAVATMGTMSVKISAQIDPDVTDPAWAPEGTDFLVAPPNNPFGQVSFLQRVKTDVRMVSRNNYGRLLERRHPRAHPEELHNAVGRLCTCEALTPLEACRVWTHSKQRWLMTRAKITGSCSPWARRSLLKCFRTPPYAPTNRASTTARFLDT